MSRCGWLLAGVGIDAVLFCQPAGAWVRYYSDPDLNEWVALRSETEMAKDYRKQPPFEDSIDKPFSARWTAWLLVPEDGEYVFATHSDDGVRLYIDHELVIDNWKEQDWHRSQRQATVTLAEGRHPLTLDYFTQVGRPLLRVEWTGESIPAKTRLGRKHLRKRIGKP